MSQPLFRTPKGTHDVLPEDHQYMTYIKKAVRHRARQAGFKRIDTPMFEDRGIFERGIGAHTDIVEKELYFVTAKEREGPSPQSSPAGRGNHEPEFALRPEFTAGICRAYIEHGMQQLPQPVQLYAIGPCFRHDRPQKGRYRQFHQFDFEIIGLKNPSLDAQLIHILTKVFDDIRILPRLTLHINTIGTAESRQAYMAALRDFFIGKESRLPELDRMRLDVNPLRLLDSKEEDTRLILKSAPALAQFLSDESKQYHATLCECLAILGIPYTENATLVRGLDYYTQTVFEFWDSSTGAQNAVGGGGRYDGLMELLGGKPAPGSGAACGMERMIWHMKEAGIRVPNKDQIDVFVAQLGPEAKKQCLLLIAELREKGVHTLGSLGEASLKSQMGLADKFDARYALVLGKLEVKKGTIILRDMKAGKQQEIPYDTAIPEVLRLLGASKLDTYVMNDQMGPEFDED